MSVDDYARLKPRQHGAFDGPASTRRTEEDCSGSQSEQPFAFDEPLKIEKIEITQYEGGLSDVPQINLTAPSPKTQGAGKYENHSLVVRKRLKQDSNRKYQPHETLAEFRDPEIQKALQILLQHFNYHNLASLPIKFKHPYHDLFWIRDELQTYQSSLQRSDKERSSLEVLSKFINEQHEKAFKDYQQLIPNGFITFNRLWTLFPPNRVIISVVDGLQRAYRVSSGKLIENHPKDDTYFELTCWGWGYDDGYFGRFETKLKVSEFDKAQKILELEVYPLECLPEREQKELQNELVEGGRKWSQMITTSHKYYNGEESTTPGASSFVTPQLTNSKEWPGKLRNLTEKRIPMWVGFQCLAEEANGIRILELVRM